MEPKMILRVNTKIEKLNIDEKTKELLYANGVLSLGDLVKRISEKLSKKTDISLKEATIDFLLNLRRFGKDEADDLMKELKNIRFFEQVDWDKEVEQRKKEQQMVKERKMAKIEAKKAAKRAARGEE